MIGAGSVMTPGSGDPAVDDARSALPMFAPVDFTHDAASPDEQPALTPVRPWLRIIVFAALVIGWTAFFAWSQRAALPSDVRAAPQLITWWAVPLLLLGVAWLILVRGGLRNAAAFVRAARELEEQSSRLGTRLAAANRELSLAREFIAAQARDLDSVGRIAADRLTESGTRLQQLVQANGERVDTIASTSRAALDNMEQLRAQLPVLTTATRDLGNTIGSAGQTARGHIAELDRALAHISEAQVGNIAHAEGLRRSASETVAELAQRTDQLAMILANRFNALTDRSTALGAEGDRIAAAMRDAEAAAISRWREAAARIEADVSGALVLLDNAERDAFAASHRRLLALSDDAERVDALIDERARTFAKAIEDRRLAASAADEAAVALFARHLREVDEAVMTRQAEHARQGEAIAGHAETIAARLEQSGTRVGEIVERSRRARDEVETHVRELVASLADGRETLAATDGDVRALITSSERVRDLLDAAATRSHEDLPAVLASGETRLHALQDAMARLGRVVADTGERGDAVAARLGETAADIRARLDMIGERQSLASADAVAHLGHLDAIDDRLRDIAESGSALSDRAQGDFADMLAALVRDMTEAGASAFDRALRNAAAQTAGRIEQAAAHAAGVGSEVAGQLGREIARVEEQTAALEARLASAQERAEAPLDRDFARRAALITETLNSHAIDIAGALTQDQPDTAWAAYLRGDRGVFTRRAVRLLDGGQSRAIVSLYEGDPSFRDHASRYIHDFEAILRELLSARDGHVLAVTMLSSDLGKLYVALAQAIERLRS